MEAWSWSRNESEADAGFSHQEDVITIPPRVMEPTVLRRLKISVPETASACQHVMPNRGQQHLQRPAMGETCPASIPGSVDLRASVVVMKPDNGAPSVEAQVTVVSGTCVSEKPAAAAGDRLQKLIRRSAALFSELAQCRFPIGRGGGHAMHS